MLIVDIIGTIDDLVNLLEEQNKVLNKIGDLYYQKNNLREVPIKKMKIKYGDSIPSKKRVTGSYHLFGSNGLIDEINTFNVKNPLVYFGCRGSIGHVGFATTPSFILNTALYVESREDYGNLYFAFKSFNGFSSRKSGTSQPQITLEDINDINVKLPTTKFLNNICDLISLNTNKMQYLKKYKSRILNLLLTNLIV